ncbi:MAG: isoprenylcysteine carboxyl methyltransferase [Phenylobacterium sp.]|nr:isoprenylcysteine carboxyl methyltransferase [Phenylobacterium sp.]
MKPPAGVRTVDLAERAVVLVAIALSLSANLASHWLNVASLGNDLLVALLILIRRPAQVVSQSVLDWLLAFGAALGVLAMRPGGAPLIGAAWAAALVVPGWLIALAAALSLNRRFGIVAANRGVQTRGAYAVVRHPMYLGYFLNHTAYLLLNPTALNLAVWLGVCGCQVGRVLREERLLIADPAYRAYAAKTRFRILPWVI